MTPRREALVAFGAALLVASALLGPHVVSGGRYLDDWWLAGYVNFPHTFGFANGLDYLSFYAGGRPGGMFYWLLSNDLLGFHDAWQRAINVLLAAVLGGTFYLLLRELRLSRTNAAAAALLSLALPIADSIRFWITPGIGQMCVTLCLAGYLVALRGLELHGRRAALTHAGAVAFFAMSALFAETMLPAIGLSVLLYRVRAGWRPALARWGADLVLVVVAVVYYAANTPKRSVGVPGGFHGYLAHARVIIEQAATLVAGTLVPLDVPRDWVLAALILLGLAAMLRGGKPERWAGVAGIAVLFLLASYAIYVPADPAYRPLTPAIGNRMNLGATLPLSALAVAAARAAGSFFGRPRQALLVASVVWAIAFVPALIRLHEDRTMWGAAAGVQQRTLAAMHQAVPHPRPKATLIVLNAPGVLTRYQRLGQRSIYTPFPVFSTWWELDMAAKLSYRRADVNAYPMWAHQPAQIACGSHRLYQLGLDGVRHALTYRDVFVVDARTREGWRVTGKKQCTALLDHADTVTYDVPA